MQVLIKWMGFRLGTALLMTMLFVLAGTLVKDANAGQKMNPCGISNPCSTKMSNTPIRKYPLKSYDKVSDRGERLWVDSTLGKSGTSCSTCHPGGTNLNSEPYPKYINMADDVLTLDQMINFCMVNPMKGKALGWNSQKMTALAAYVSNHSKATTTKGMNNPCSVKNPCGIKNPCSTNNPCSVKNLCGTK